MTGMTISQRQEAIVNEFSSLSNWEDRYKKIIVLGKSLPELPEELKTEEAKVKGCQSQVWLHASLNDKNQIIFRGDSDALLVRGLVALLIQVYNESTPAEILSTKADFIQKMGFEGNLSPSRSNGLFSMLKQIQHFAMAFQVLLNSKRGQ
jgi:cysteine desulfuration protein SufE